MSSFSDAIQANMLQSIDPMNGIMRQFAQSQSAVQQLDLIRQKGQLLTEIETMLTAAQERNADQSVIASYQKLMAQLTV